MAFDDVGSRTDVPSASRRNDLGGVTESNAVAFSVRASFARCPPPRRRSPVLAPSLTLALTVTSSLFGTGSGGYSVPAATPASVLVVGGTPAGVAAAVAAARAGQRVTLVSATNDLGGVMTDAMMDQWDLNEDAAGHPIERGIFSELYRKLGDVFTPESAARELAAYVAREPGIRVLYGRSLRGVDVAPAADGARVTTVRFRNGGGGETVIAPTVVVDATDDADVAAAAGARYDVGRQDTGIDEREQAVTTMFSVSGVAWSTVLRSYDVARDGAGGAGGQRAWGYHRDALRYRPSSGDIVVRDFNLGRMPDGTVTVNAINLCGVEGLDPAAVGRAQVAGDREASRLVEFMRAQLPGFEHARLARFAATPYVRETRHIAGLARLTTEDVWTSRVPEDSIGLSSYPLDLHPVDPSDRPAFAPIRHVYGVPFGALVPRGLANVVLASPAISATHEAAGSARIVPTTIEEGEADGWAAALAVREGVSFPTIDATPRLVATLRSRLATDSFVGRITPPSAERRS